MQVIHIKQIAVFLMVSGNAIGKHSMMAANASIQVTALLSTAVLQAATMAYANLHLHNQLLRQLSRFLLLLLSQLLLKVPLLDLLHLRAVHHQVVPLVVLGLANHMMIVNGTIVATLKQNNAHLIYSLAIRAVQAVMILASAMITAVLLISLMEWQRV